MMDEKIKAELLEAEKKRNYIEKHNLSKLNSQ